MNQTRDNSNTFSSASAKGKWSESSDKKAKIEINNAGKVASWVGGILFGVLPVLICLFFAWMHESDTAMANRYSTYVSDFISNGSFLWLSITLLAMSLFDLLLYGFRDNVSETAKFWYKIFVCIAVIVGALGVYIYLNNISNPVDSNKMKAISWVLFVLYAIASGIVSFKIVREV